MNVCRPLELAYTMRTIALVSQAPGSGRTSLALALSLAAARARVPVMAADLDPERDLGGRLRVRFEDPEAPWDVLDLPRGLSICYPTPESLDVCALAIHDHGARDLLILDTVNGLGPATEAVLSISDIAVVPVRAEPIALRAAQATATRFLHLRMAFAFVALGENAATVVPALRELGAVAGTLSDPNSEGEAGALLANLRKMLSGRPPVPIELICRDRIAVRTARKIAREPKAQRSGHSVDLAVRSGRHGRSRPNPPRRVGRHQETIAAR